MSDEPLIDADRSSQLAVAIRPSKASRVLLVGIVILVLAGVAGGVTWHLGRQDAAGPLVARRVAYDLRGWPEGEGRVRDALHEAIEGAGLEAVPASGGGSHDLAELASSEEATQAAVLTLEVVEERAGLGEGSRFVVGRVTAGTADLTEGAAPREPLAVTLAAEASSRDDALRDIGQRAVEMLAPHVAAELVTSPAIAALVEGRAAANVSRINTVRRALGGAVSREEAVTSFAQSCQAAEGDLAAAAGAARARPLTAACGRARPVGMTPDGGAAIVLVDGAVPWFPLETPARPRPSTPPARIDLVPTGEGGSRRTLSHGVSFPEVETSEDGTMVFAIEESGSRTGLVAVSVAGGGRRLLASVQGPERLSEPRPSPDGQRVAYVHASGPRDSGRRLVVAVTGGEELDLPPAARSARWIHIGSGDDERLVIAALATARLEEAREAERAALRQAGARELPEKAPRLRHVVLLSPETGEVVSRHWDVFRHVDAIAGVHGGALIVLSRRSRDSGCALGRIEEGAPEITWTPVEPCPSELSQAANGLLLGVARASSVDDPERRDVEVVFVDPSTGLVTPLTANAITESSPRGAGAAPWVTFSASLPAPWRELHRSAVLAAFLPFSDSRPSSTH